MRDARYQTSFTRAALLPLESLRIAELYVELGDWEKVREAVIQNNLLQARTENTLAKIYQELAARLSLLDRQELELLVQSDRQQQGYILWLATCRRYPLIADFAVEVLHDHYLLFKPVVTREDFVRFLNQKGEWHEEIDALSDSTRGKIRQIVFKMMREAGLIGEQFQIFPALLNATLVQMLYRKNRKELAYFPIYEVDAQRMVQ